MALLHETLHHRFYSLPDPSHRKRILFACASTREIWHLLIEESKKLVVLAEGYVERFIDAEEVKKAFNAFQPFISTSFTSWNIPYFSAKAATETARSVFAIGYVTSTAWAAS